MSPPVTEGLGLGAKTCLHFAGARYNAPSLFFSRLAAGRKWFVDARQKDLMRIGGRMMRWLLTFLSAAVAVCVITAVSVEEKKETPHEYVGSKQCRICHNAPAKGSMSDIWSKTKHAEAHPTLLTPAAKEAAKKLGIKEPEKSGECLRCHSTAYGMTKKQVTEKIKVEEGVGCESCHGAGKDYAKLGIMEDRQKSVPAGMIYPAKDICVKCHNAESPTWNPERYTDKNGNKVGFDFEVLWEMIKHSTPREEKK